MKNGMIITFDGHVSVAVAIAPGMFVNGYNELKAAGTEYVHEDAHAVYELLSDCLDWYTYECEDLDALRKM